MGRRIGITVKYKFIKCKFIKVENKWNYLCKFWEKHNFKNLNLLIKLMQYIMKQILCGDTYSQLFGPAFSWCLLVVNYTCNTLVRYKHIHLLVIMFMFFKTLYNALVTETASRDREIIKLLGICYRGNYRYCFCHQVTPPCQWYSLAVGIRSSILWLQRKQKNCITVDNIYMYHKKMGQGQSGCPNRGTHRLPLLRDKQVALIGGHTGCPYWGTHRLPLLSDKLHIEWGNGLNTEVPPGGKQCLCCPL